MKCLICGSEKKTILSKLCSNMGIMGPFFENKESFIVSCEHCGNVYIDIDATQNDFTEYYNSEYSKSLSYFEVFGKEETTCYYENIANRVAKYINRDSKILEIGGGIGELAQYLQMKGYEDITVLEPSERCVELCKQKDLKVILDDALEPIAEYEDKFDFVIINHTLEHILRFDKVLTTAKKYLKKTGKMYIEVPDATHYPNSNFVPYWFFTYEHVVHMSMDTFENIGYAFGLHVMEQESYLKCHSYYVTYAIFEKGGVELQKIKKIETTEKAIREYIAECEEKLKPIINELVQKQEKLILWGVGTSTAQLLNGNFDNCNVIQLIDSNPYRQGTRYRVGNSELIIEDPTDVKDENATIVVLPLMYDASIRKQIMGMNLKNPVKSLIEEYKGEK